MSESKCEHTDIARDDNIWTCISCGTVVKEKLFVVPTNYNLQIKKTTGKNVIRSENFMMFRDTTPITELRKKAKTLGIKYVNNFKKDDLKKAIEIKEDSDKSKSRTNCIKANQLKINSIRSKSRTHLIKAIQLKEDCIKSKSQNELRKIAKDKGVKNINSFDKEGLIKAIKQKETSLPESIESKSLVKLRKIAKDKGLKRINSYSKKELIDQLKK